MRIGRRNSAQLEVFFVNFKEAQKTPSQLLGEIQYFRPPGFAPRRKNVLHCSWKLNQNYRTKLNLRVDLVDRR